MRTEQTLHTALIPSHIVFCKIRVFLIERKSLREAELVLSLAAFKPPLCPNRFQSRL